jgi:acetolactate synthase-1/2/3 large subunit
MMRSGGRILVDQLVVHGADLAFTVPGESFLPVLDALYDVREKLKLVVCRHEAGAANMAEAHGKLTNRPGICFVTRGPGAAHAAIGVHTAFQDSTPMILFIGDVGSDFRGREAFQEVDFAAMFAPLAKWADRIDDPARIPEFVARAFQVATSGRRGPVVLALPEDMLSKEVEAPDARRFTPSEPHPAPEDMQRLQGLLAAAQRPLVILGGSGWTPEACDDMRRFVEANALSCTCAFRFQDLSTTAIRNTRATSASASTRCWPSACAPPTCCSSSGARPGEMTDERLHAARFARCRANAWSTSIRARRSSAACTSPSSRSSRPSALRARSGGTSTGDDRPWASATPEARADYEAWTKRKDMPGRVQMCDIIEWLDRNMPPDTIYTELAPATSPSGCTASTATRHGAPSSRPRRRDGLRRARGDRGEDRASAARGRVPRRRRRFPHVRAGARDRGAVRRAGHLHRRQQRHVRHDPHAPGAPLSGTRHRHGPREPALRGVCALLRRGGDIVEDTAQFAPAMERALASKRPAVIEVRIDPQAITPNTTLDALRKRK